MVAPRTAGFTLAEILVSLVLLAAGGLALAAAAQRLQRTTRTFLDAERAHAVASWTVDSLLASDAVVPGSTTSGPLVVSWGPDGALVWARVLDARGRALAELSARRGPRLPALPAPAP